MDMLLIENQGHTCMQLLIIGRLFCGYCYADGFGGVGTKLIVPLSQLMCSGRNPQGNRLLSVLRMKLFHLLYIDVGWDRL